MLFVKLVNGAESRYVPVEDTHKIKQILNYKDGNFNIECDAVGNKVLYDEKFVRHQCNERLWDKSPMSIEECVEFEKCIVEACKDI